MNIITVLEYLPDNPLLSISHFIGRNRKKKALSYFLKLAKENGATPQEEDTILQTGTFITRQGYTVVYSESFIQGTPTK